jgi:hypothetical protein
MPIAPLFAGRSRRRGRSSWQRCPDRLFSSPCPRHTRRSDPSEVGAGLGETRGGQQPFGVHTSLNAVSCEFRERGTSTIWRVRGRVNDFRTGIGLEAGHRSVRMVRRYTWEGTLLRENRACKLALYLCCEPRRAA